MRFIRKGVLLLLQSKVVQEGPYLFAMEVLAFTMTQHQPEHTPTGQIYLTLLGQFIVRLELY